MQYNIKKPLYKGLTCRKF